MNPIKNKEDDKLQSIDEIEKHPLQYKWDWLYKPHIAYSNQSEKDWLSDCKKIWVCDTIENFWRMFNNIPSWKNLSAGSMYAMFKKGINPSWEDENNEGGFSWILYISQRVNEASVEDIYLRIVLMLIGNMFEHSLLLNGCTFEKKARGDKIVFWFRKNNSEKAENIVIDPKGLLRLILKEIKIDERDCCVLGPDEKIDWKGQKLRQKKIAIKLIHHNTNIKTKAT